MGTQQIWDLSLNMTFRLFPGFRGENRPAPEPTPAQRRMASISEKIEAIRASGLPLQCQETELSALGKSSGNLDESVLIRSHADFIADTMTTRNDEAAHLERLHRPEQAIALYEANVADRFKGGYPYQRLWALYGAAGRVEDARRVCEALLDYTDLDEANKKKYRDWLSGLRRTD